MIVCLSVIAMNPDNLGSIIFLPSKNQSDSNDINSIMTNFNILEYLK